MNRDRVVATDFFRIVWKEYKEYIIVFCVFSVSFFVFMRFIVPQIQEYYSEQSIIEEEKAKLSIMRNNFQLLSSISDRKQQEDLRIAIQTLPSEKDFIGVLSALKKASSVANIALGNFTFQVGELSTPSAQLAHQPALTLTVSLLGDQRNINTFLQVLSESAPLSEPEEIQITRANATLIISFYFKPFQKKHIDYTQPLQPISAKQQQTLQTISKWQKDPVLESEGTSSTTNSARFQ